MSMTDSSRRINIIQSIAHNLSRSDWSIIDLTLQEFGFPTTDSWNGEHRDYILEMIKNGTLESLVDLAKHLDIKPENIATSSRERLSPNEINSLVQNIETQKSLMISVATGKLRINEVNNEYTTRRTVILNSLEKSGIKDPNPHVDLWAWYGKWSDGSLPTYNSRRTYVAELYQPLLDQLQIARKSELLVEPAEPTGWERVDRSIDKVAQNLSQAEKEEDFQTVGFLCRECLISLAQAVYNPDIHAPLDGVTPSETDAKRMLESFISNTLEGGSNEELRKYAKDACQLASALLHKRTADFQAAALCAEATRSLINIIAILSGQRNQ